MLKLKLQYFGHLIWRTNSLEMTLMLGKIEGRRRRGWQRKRRLDDIISLIDMSLSKLQEIVKDRETWHAAVHGGHKESDITEWLNNIFALWTEIHLWILVVTLTTACGEEKKIWWRESETWTLSITKVIKMGTGKREESQQWRSSDEMIYTEHLGLWRASQISRITSKPVCFPCCIFLL